MIEWLAVRGVLGAPRWLILAVLLIGAVAALIMAIDRHDQAQRAAGAASVTATQLEQSVKRVEQANEVRSEIRDPGSSARHDQCLRSARTPANCQRFMPQRPVNLDRSGTGPGR